MYDYNVETELALRTCNADGTSYNDFQWPLGVGEIAVAPDWDAIGECGKGLHGALHGRGDGSLLDWSEDAKWLVVEMPRDLIVDLDGKVKAPWARVVHVGDQVSATEFLKEAGHDSGVIGQNVVAGRKGIATAGDWGSATAGHYGCATAGYKGSATVGDGGSATAGYYGCATAGYYGSATAGDEGSATAGDEGSATAGDEGSATAGYGGTATAGDEGSATAGYGGTATAGYRGSATAGRKGSATAGEEGMISIKYWKGGRHRLKVGYIGEEGLEPNVKYELDNDFNFVKVDALDLKGE